MIVFCLGEEGVHKILDFNAGLIVRDLSVIHQIVGHKEVLANNAVCVVLVGQFEEFKEIVVCGGDNHLAVLEGNVMAIHIVAGGEIAKGVQQKGHGVLTLVAVAGNAGQGRGIRMVFFERIEKLRKLV